MNQKEQQIQPKISVSIREFAAMTGIGINRVREMCYLDGFPAYKVGNRMLIHVGAAGEWLRAKAEAKENVDVAALKRVNP